MIELFLIVIEQVCLYIPLLIGSYISFSLMKVPNLSIEAAFVSGAIVASKVLCCMQGSCFCLAATCCAGLIGGLLVGAIVATLELVCNVPHLLASIITLGLCYGLNLYVLGT